jgi:hypothetical protein
MKKLIGQGKKEKKKAEAVATQIESSCDSKLSGSYVSEHRFGN